MGYYIDIKTNRDMELLYYISGVLSVGLIYGVILLRNVKSSHIDLASKYQSQSNVSSIRNADLVSRLEDMESWVNDIQSKMETDHYEGLSKLNKRVDELMNLAVENKDKALNVEIRQNSEFSKAFSEIQQLKATIKDLQQGDFLSRY